MINTQCMQCTSKSIKTINVTTGECISCFPCLQCDDGHTSSVPCGLTVPFGTEIKCVLKQSDHVSSTQTRYQTATLQTISSSTKVVAAPITSISHPVDVSATSSSTSVRPSIKQNDGSENTMVYILIIGICLAITLVAIVYKIIKWKSSKHIQLHAEPVNPGRPPTTSIQPRCDVTPRDNETCNISLPTGTVTYTHHNDHATWMRDGNQRSQHCIPPAHSSSLDATAGNLM